MKKNKNGFFLPETIVVISIVAVVLLGVFQVFSSVFLRYTETEKYNTVNSLNAVAAVQKYLESTSVNFEDVLGDAYYLDLTDNYSSEIFKRIKEEYGIDKAYLVDLNQLFQDDNIGVFNVTTRKYLETFNKQNGIILVVQINGNEFSSSKVGNSNSLKLKGDENDEYAVYLSVGEEFVDPGYKNWNGKEPTLTWERELDINTEGMYYLIYDFDGYLIRRKVVVSIPEYVFEYTGSEQTFVATKTGTYKLEVWGAQGGGTGGYGSYSVAEILLSKGDTLYINVGGAGVTTAGGYNGGGTALTEGYGGGGASHIATKSGLLSTLSSSIDNILIVAGGGGGSSKANTGTGAGGSAGGISGSKGVDGECSSKAGSGGSQTAGGACVDTSYSNTGAFGIGGAGKGGNYGGAGGGGFYGGGSGTGGGCYGGGGGGSGYIGNSLLTNKSMYCYNCTESSDESTKTISTTCANETATEDCSKIGNGYAKISLMS